MIAAQGAGVHGIGYANKPHKRELLADSGAIAVVDSMTQILGALDSSDQGERRPSHAACH